MRRGAISAALTGASLAGLVLAGCGRSHPAGAVQGAAGAPIAVNGQAPAACGKELTTADVAELLGPGPIAINPSQVNSEACDFRAGPGSIITVGLRAGDEVADSWKLTVDLNHEAMIPMAGLGEQALRTRDGGEVMARKGSLSCQVDLVGLDRALALPSVKGDPQALATKLGALCAKVFAGRHA